MMSWKNLRTHTNEYNVRLKCCVCRSYALMLKLKTGNVSIIYVILVHVRQTKHMPWEIARAARKWQRVDREHYSFLFIF